MSTPATKDASVFIIDGSPSMLEPYKSTYTVSQQDGSQKDQSRLTSAIKAVQVLISSQMLRSKTHEVSVILLGSRYTDNRLATAHAASAYGGYGGYDGMVEVRRGKERRDEHDNASASEVIERIGGASCQIRCAFSSNAAIILTP